MPQYNRPPKARPKKADEFVSFFDHVTRYFMIHQMKFWTLLAAGVVALGGYGIYRYRISQRLHDLAVEYMQAEQTPPAEAATAWQSFAKQNPPSPLAQIVGLQLGGAYAQNQQWNEAAQAFQKSATSKSFLLESVAKLAAATSMENAKNYSQALDSYRAVAEQASNPFRYRGKLGMARCYAGMGQGSDAENILLQLLVKGSDAPEPIKSSALNQLIAMKAKQNPETH